MKNLSRWAGLGALAVFLAALPQALPNNYYVDVAVLACFNAIICVGLNLLIGYAGQISLGHAGFFGLGAYASAVLVNSYGWPPLLALLAGAVIVGLMAFAIARPVLKLKGHYLAMATLGIGIIISIVINTEAGITGGPDGIAAGPFSIGSFKLAGERDWYWLVAGLLLATVWLATNLVDSPVGRALRALHGSEVGAEVVGVDTARYKVLVFVVSAVIASVAGSLFAHYTPQLTPTKADFFKSIELVTMVVFGGMASTFGAIVGAAFLTMLPQVLTVFEDYEPVILGGIMMGTMIFMPKGLVPTIAALFNRRRP
ncbi:MAG: branched-chain amino acid ABC transporter permease [Rhodospirillales bacterium]|jgi:branched-chain amino acid transport system permease protein|nr:branched-chain amino acid ABC transporter permease [Rhodospirillales bacterium]